MRPETEAVTLKQYVISWIVVGGLVAFIWGGDIYRLVHHAFFLTPEEARAEQIQRLSAQVAGDEAVLRLNAAVRVQDRADCLQEVILIGTVGPHPACDAGHLMEVERSKDDARLNAEIERDRAEIETLSHHAASE